MSVMLQSLPPLTLRSFMERDDKFIIDNFPFTLRRDATSSQIALKEHLASATTPRHLELLNSKTECEVPGIQAVEPTNHRQEKLHMVSLLRPIHCEWDIRSGHARLVDSHCIEVKPLH